MTPSLSPLEECLAAELDRIGHEHPEPGDAYNAAMNQFQVDLAHAVAAFIAGTSTNPAGLFGVFLLNLTGALHELLDAPDGVTH